MAYVTKFSGNTDTTVTLGKEGQPKSIEGYFLGTKDTPDSGYGPGKLHIFQTEAGAVGIWGKTRLNNLLTADLIGQMTLVTFTGMIQPKAKGKRPSYGFEVKHDPSNKIDTSNINLSASEPADEDEEDDTDSNNDYTPPAAKKNYNTSPQPTTTLSAPSSDKQAKLQALLNSRK